MPLYEYRCANGHAFEALRGADVQALACECGGEALRSAVYKNSSPRKFGSEFHWTPSMKAAHDEALGYKAEAMRAKEEAVMNGWKGTTDGDS